MRLEIERTEPGLVVHYEDADLAIATRGPEIFLASPDRYFWRSHVVIPDGWKIERRGFEPVERLTRRGIQFIKHVEGDTFVALYNRSLYRFNAHASKSRHLWTLARGRRVLRNGACVVGGEILIGDYWQNEERTDVRVHQVDLDSGNGGAFLTFPPTKIRHVHLIQRDPFTGRFWIGTGDDDHECMLLEVDASDPRLQTVGGGSQKWRAVSLAFDERSVMWGSDDHRGSNAIYRYDRATGSLASIGSVVGPVYYSVTRGSTTIFGSTVERGGGDQDGFGRLYALTDDGELREIHSERKDAWPAGLFGYGVFEFADGPGSDGAFWVTLRGFRGGLRSLRCRLSG